MPDELEHFLFIMKADTFKVTKKPLFQIFLPVQITVDGSAYDEWLNAFLHLLTKRWVDPETHVHTEKASSGSGGKQVSPHSRSSVPAGGQRELLLPAAAALGVSCPLFCRCWAVCTVSMRCLGSVSVPDPSTKGLRSVPCFLPPLAVCSCLLPRHGTNPCAASETCTPCEIPSAVSMRVQGLSAGREGAWVSLLTLRGKACDLALVTPRAQKLREKMQDAFRSCVSVNAWIWQYHSILPTLVSSLCFSLCCPCSLPSSVECSKTHEAGGRGHPLFPCFVSSLVSSELIRMGGCCLRLSE